MNSFSLAKRVLLFTGIACLSCSRAFSAPFVQANLLTNGDFEVNTASGCLSNLSNAQVNQFLATAVGFGTAHEIDVYPTACYGLPAISGTTKVGLASQASSVDAMSLQLSTTVFAGEPLDLAFAVQGVVQFNPNLPIVEIGLSSVANDFGTQVYTSILSAPNVWEWSSATIVAPIDANFLTMRTVANGGWAHVDAFSLTSGAGTLFCSGDGSGLPCPCANGTAPNRGCANSSFASGARLYRTGSAGASATTDSLILKASEVAGTGLFIQGTSHPTGGGYAFGDGLLCVSGNLVRLGISSPVAGLALLPHAAAPTPIHVAGGVASGDVRHYQFWYRDAIPYCTPDTFNLSQGMTITWGP